jgi:Fic family protein
MMTLKRFAHKLESVPLTTVWYLSELAEARGKQELFTLQSPQKLKVLREHALIESAICSNRIEGVEVEPSRIGAILSGGQLLRDRNEEEVRGYRDALRLIHEKENRLPVSEETLLQLHRLSRGGVGDAGQYKEKPSDIIEKQPDGRVRVRFRTVLPSKTPEFVRQTIDLWEDTLQERKVNPLLLLAAMNLDFLCIHPFRDGNGRVSRLLLLQQCYHLGFEVGRYISIERLIEENKERYYETLEQSSSGWHEGKHDPWPYINYLLFILKSAYQEFEDRVGKIVSPKGAKAELVMEAIRRQNGEFRLSDIERLCPGVGREWIRTLLAELRKTGEVICRGKGLAARWRFLRSKGITLK